jgi:hypothetical protein
MWPRPRPSFTTILAGFISILLSLAWMAIGGAFIAVAVISGAEQEFRRSLGEFVALIDVLRVLGGVIGAVIFVIALLTLIFGWKIFRRRGWARILQIIFFSGFLIGTLFLLFAGGSVDAEFEDIAAYTLFFGSYAGILGLVILLLILPPTSRDFRRVREWEAPAPQLQVQPVTPHSQQPPPPPPPPATAP